MADNPQTGVPIIEGIAYLTAPSGNRYQVINEDGTDWDEAATHAAYTAGEVPRSSPAVQG
jgi:hypothetical protein